MNQPEVTPGLLSLLPSFSALQAPVSPSGEAAESQFSGVLSELLPVEEVTNEALPGGDSLPLSGQILSSPQTNTETPLLREQLPDEYQPQLLLERIRESQQISDSALSPVAQAAAASTAPVNNQPAAVARNVASTALPDDVNKSSNGQALTEQLLPEQPDNTDADPALQAQVVGQSKATVIAKPVANQTGAERVETTAPQVTADPLAQVASSATDGQVLTRSDQFASSDDALVTDAELQQLEEQQQQIDSKERLDFGRDKQQWTPAMGSRIVTMVAENIQQAEIHLDPPELGSLEIKLQVNQEQANVQVQVQNPQVKEVLEANAQRLKDELAEQGLELAGFDVSQQEHGQSGDSSGGSSDDSEPSGEWLADTTDGENQETVKVTSHNGVLDAYA
ncbi:flagellar hook-length control protein FliK [Bacterioplanoides sp.]|uniref:flagellar hook-length control protein FliK n=1 Tax=Bacterioplanoides sp. TaxID=2066072 RepID=UPI003B5957CB